jgi:hypothetical protein
MDLLFISILLLMLLIIICGAVAWCYAAYKKACRAVTRLEALAEGQDFFAGRLGALSDRITVLEEKAAEIDAQSAKRDKKADRYDRQYAALQSFQLKDYGLRFSGSDTNDEEVTADED